MPDIREPIPQRQAKEAGELPIKPKACPECLLRDAFYKEILALVRDLDMLLRRSDIGLAETVGVALTRVDRLSKTLALALSPAGMGGTPPTPVSSVTAPFCDCSHGK